MSTDRPAAITNPRFLPFERNLTRIGYFTPTSRFGLRAAKKVVLLDELNTPEGPARHVVEITANPSYGLPSTADQDRYLALVEMLQVARRELGEFPREFAFTSASMLRVLGLTRTQKNYELLARWGKRLKLTGVESKIEWRDASPGAVRPRASDEPRGAIYLPKRKAYLNTVTSVFDAYTHGGRVSESGVIQFERNVVKLSEWHVESLSADYTLGIDIESYRRLKSPIAKTLLPLLKVWLYASQDQKVFQVGCARVSEYLGLTTFEHRSRILSQFDAPLAELKAAGYISRFEVARASAPGQFKFLLYHGPRFRSELAARRQPALEFEPDEFDPAATLRREVLELFVARGVTPGRIERIAAAADDDELDRMRALVAELDRRHYGATNPGGYLMSLVERGSDPRPRHRRARAAAATVSSAPPEEDFGRRQHVLALQAASETDDIQALIDARLASYSPERRTDLNILAEQNCLLVDEHFNSRPELEQLAAIESQERLIVRGTLGV